MSGVTCSLRKAFVLPTFRMADGSCRELETIVCPATIFAQVEGFEGEFFRTTRELKVNWKLRVNQRETRLTLNYPKQQHPKKIMT